MTPRISAVVPTHRRPDLLNRCLEALMSQDLPGQEYEVIVADDAASTETERQIQCWAERAARDGPAVRYVSTSGGVGPAAARNRGWRSARGAVIAFTDDDCIPEPDWLRQVLAALEEGADGASGRIVMPIPETPTDYEKDAAGLEGAEFATANCAYRRDALESVGGFDERFRIAWREDADVFLSLLERNADLVPAPNARVVHPVRPARWGVSLRQQHKTVYNALLYKKHPVLYAVVQPTRPLGYYLTIASALLGLAGWARGGGRPARLGALLWTLLTLRFILQRLRGTSHAPSHVAEMIVTSILIPPLAVYWRLRGAIKYRVRFY